jgi:hypothetical protein
MPIKPGLQPTSAKMWRESAIKTVTLPSGNVARLRRLSMLNLVNGGQGAPDLLSGIVAQAMEGRKVQLSGQDMPALTQMLNLFCREAFVEPKVAPDGQSPTDDMISVEDIDDKDKMWLVDWLMGGDGSAAAAFPTGSLPSMDDVPNGDGAGVAAILPAGTAQ